MIVPLISPSKSWMSSVALIRAMVTRAMAERSVLLARRSIKPWLPRALEKSLIYDPGSPFNAVKLREVSSMNNGLFNWLK